MTTQLANNSSQQDGLKDSLLEFPDNRLLIDLCGEYDRNLAMIEKGLDVQIVRRGNQLSILGSAAGLSEATSVLQSLYQRLELGRPIEAGDIDGELRMTVAEGGSADRSIDQLEVFSGPKVEIKTRKKSD